MPIIKSTGHFWHRRYVNWQNDRQLVGVSESSPGKPVNFEDQAAIYALYDKEFKCIYVGQAGSRETKGLYDRLKDHAIDDYLFCRWERFSWWGFYSLENLERQDYDKQFKISTDVNEIMDMVESMIIRVNPPTLNMALGKLTGVEWFYQEAEFEEQRAEYEQLRKICPCMGTK
jgi:hypothetical protein